jgi:hypothetical protein
MTATGSSVAGQLSKKQRRRAQKDKECKRKMEREPANNPDENNRKFARSIKSKPKCKTTIGSLKTKNGGFRQTGTRKSMDTTCSGPQQPDGSIC